MKSFLKNDNNIVLLRIMIEIIPKGIMFEIILLGTIMTSFFENNNDIISKGIMIKIILFGNDDSIILQE